MNLPHRRRAFTLLEASIAITIFSVVGLITYGVASEGLYAFSRNVSINRSYSEARRTMDRIGSYLQTAGYTPQLIDASGNNTTLNPALGINAAAGIRFWRFSNTPIYNINTPNLTDTSLTLSLYNPDPNFSTTLILPPVAGDIITVPALGIQATAVSVNVASSGTTATVNLSGSVSSLCKPAITSIPTSGALYTKVVPMPSPTPSPAMVTIQYTCTDWHPVAFIAVGTQLRYYPTFISGQTAVNDPTSYRVLATLVPSVGGGTTPLPFSAYPVAPSPTINVDIYAQAPDYNNRNLNSANIYSYFSTAFSPRNPYLLVSPP